MNNSAMRTLKSKFSCDSRAVRDLIHSFIQAFSTCLMRDFGHVGWAQWKMISA